MTASLLYDVKAALAQPDWRNRAVWPVPMTETHKRVGTAWDAVWPFIRSRDPQEQDILLLAGSRIMTQCLALAEAASVVQAAAERGWAVEGAPAAVRYLMSASDSDPIPAEFAPTPFKTARRISFAGPRRMVRSFMLSAPRALPRLLWAPDAVALSHNHMMHSYAHRHGFAVRFTHADEIMREAISRAPGIESRSWIANVAEPLANIALTGRSIDAIYRNRFLHLAMPFIEAQLRQAAHIVDGMRLIPKLPRRIWCGVQQSSRYIATEVRRRGGHVTAFEHGWGLACEAAASVTAFAELAIVDRFVALTPVSAKRLAASAAHGIASPERRIEFVAGPGDSGAPEDRLDAKTPNGRSRPKVMYAPTIIAGFRQFLPPLLPDAVHLDWQFRLSEALQAMPIDFICRPHPEGIFRNQRHPLSAIAEVPDQPFESLMADSDVFVFDFQQSTTFGRALCSGKPIVLIDLGTSAFDPETETALRRRCRVVTARYDEFNRPFVDSAELRAAVLGSQIDPIDSGYFRSLMIGE